MKKVKNISEQELTILGVGKVLPGQEVEVNDEFNNANFENVPRETFVSKSEQRRIAAMKEDKKGSQPSEKS